MWTFPAGDLTEKQKKIFEENRFYRGYAIPEPQELVGQVNVWISEYVLSSWIPKITAFKSVPKSHQLTKKNLLFENIGKEKLLFFSRLISEILSFLPL